MSPARPGGHTIERAFTRRERRFEMRSLVVQTMLTLDGVMQAPGGPEEDPSDGFAYGGWSVPHFDSVTEEVLSEAMGSPFDLVLGRKTYEIFAAYWPFEDSPTGETLNSAAKHVASRTLSEVEWNNSQLIEGDVPAGVARLKEQDGPELQVYGSADLIQTLLAHDLIDELRLLIFPIVLGKGKRLFADGTVPAAFEVTSSKTSTTGVVMATYRRAGDVETGSFAHEEPTEAELERRQALTRDQ
jgi:dihydrofolate reductase